MAELKIRGEGFDGAAGWVDRKGALEGGGKGFCDGGGGFEKAILDG